MLLGYLSHESRRAVQPVTMWLGHTDASCGHQPPRGGEEEQWCSDCPVLAPQFTGRSLLFLGQSVGMERIALTDIPSPSCITGKFFISCFQGSLYLSLSLYIYIYTHATVSLFVHSSMDTGCFHIFALENNAAVNMEIHMLIYFLLKKLFILC